MLAFYLSLVEGDQNKALFTEFYRRYKVIFYAVALRILRSPALAEEASHNAFLKIILHFEDFLKIYQKNRKEIRPWAVTIVRNAALDLLEKENRGTALPEAWDEAAPEDLDSQARYRELVELIRSMPEPDRQILELKFVCEWRDRDIARKLGLSEGAVSTRIHRGRAALIRRLKEEGYDRERV